MSAVTAFPSGLFVSGTCRQLSRVALDPTEKEEFFCWLRVSSILHSFLQVCAARDMDACTSQVDGAAAVHFRSGYVWEDPRTENAPGGQQRRRRRARAGRRARRPLPVGYPTYVYVSACRGRQLYTRHSCVHTQVANTPASDEEEGGRVLSFRLRSRGHLPTLVRPSVSVGLPVSSLFNPPSCPLSHAWTAAGRASTILHHVRLPLCGGGDRDRQALHVVFLLRRFSCALSGSCLHRLIFASCPAIMSSV